jgi:hypothetical protein
MAFRTIAVTLTTTPGPLFTAQAGDLEVWVGADVNADWYVGGPDVDSTTGYHRFGIPNDLRSEVRPGDELWAVAGSGTVPVNVLVRNA